ncbi:MAG: hypothetical protein ABEI31_05825 [Halodesulfurarchaeum sp.]
MDLPDLLRQTVVLYLITLVVLGGGTMLWGLWGVLRSRSILVARLWFAIAGFGLVLTAVLLLTYVRRRGPLEIERVPE